MSDNADFIAELDGTEDFGVDVVNLSCYPFKDEIFEGWKPVELWAVLQQDEEFRAPLDPFNYDGGFAAFKSFDAAKEMFDCLVGKFGDEIREELEEDGEGNGFIGIFEKDGVFAIVTGQSLGDSSWIFEKARIEHFQSAHLSAQNLPDTLPMN